MDSEWDILAEIRASMIELQETSPTLKWIKGHQDDHTPYEELSLKAQLNCQADKLADEYLTIHPDSLPFTHVPMLPTSGCQLQLSKGTVTYNIKQEVKLARTAPPLKRKLCHKNAWDETTFNDIDWTSHNRALNYHQKHRVTMVKFLNGILPIGKRVHLYNSKYQQECPSCPAPIEDSEHFWRCPATSRTKWRKDCQKAILDKLNELDTAPPLQSLLLEATKASLDGRPPHTIAIDPAAIHSPAHFTTEVGTHSRAASHKGLP
jgi:hypothetical protein